MTDDTNAKYERGRARRRELLGRETEEKFQYLETLAPDLERIIMENLFGDIYLRPGLDPRIRSLCTVSVLAAQGHTTQLRAHIGGALNVGVSKDELVEAFMQLLFYAGLPSASNALRIASEVFDERGL